MLTSRVHSRNKKDLGVFCSPNQSWWCLYIFSPDYWKWFGGLNSVRALKRCGITLSKSFKMTFVNPLTHLRDDEYSQKIRAVQDFWSFGLFKLKKRKKLVATCTLKILCLNLLGGLLWLPRGLFGLQLYKTRL